MKLSQSSLALLEDTLKKAIGKYTCGCEQTIVCLLYTSENYRPENRVYRYNFFYDNCATRPRDQIERAINGTLQYADNMTCLLYTSRCV